MAKHLKPISQALKEYLQNRFGQLFRGKQSNNDLPAALHIAYLQGEALLRMRFFDYLSQHHINDPDSQWFFWTQLIDNPDGLNVLVNNSGLATAFRKQVSSHWLEKQSNKQINYTAYCCVLQDIRQQNNSALLDAVTHRFFGHFSSSLFPASQHRTDIGAMKKDIARQLAIHWQMHPEIKESFITSKAQVEFELQARLPRHHTVSLIKLSGKRLKPTRLKACQKVLEQLQQQKDWQALLRLRTPKK